MKTLRMLLGPSALALAVTGCNWFTDFKQQPSVNSWQHFSSDSAANKGFRGNPAGSVPTTGATVPEYAISHSNSMATLDSFNIIRNPVAADARSLATGRMYYAINCAVCHGDTGDGKGSLAAAAPGYSFAPPINGDATKARTDGYLWGIIRNGRGFMPSYNRIEDMERWDVVNYVRGLQGRLAQPVPTGPLGLPGETGDKLPGATRVGPTVPSAHVKPMAGPAPETKSEGKP
jgi:mono/diheme cytochrome c family protein